MGNKEKRFSRLYVNMFMGLQRKKDGENSRCVRHVINHDRSEDLKIFKSKLRILGGIWRIHETVNKRDCAKAMKWLQKKMIDNPDIASNIDTWWRTALLQKECIYGDKQFMLDVDAEREDIVAGIISMLPPGTQYKIKTPGGWHFVVDPFDTRELINDYGELVSLHRDGYSFVEMVGNSQ